MIHLSREKVLLWHQLIIAETGGAADVRDFGILDSALESAFAPLMDKNYTHQGGKSSKIGLCSDL